MYKLIALDIDGTLLNSDGVITEATKEALAKASDEGVTVTLSTGRPVQGVEKYIGELNLKAPLITYNGGMIVEADTKKILFSQELSAADAIEIYSYGIETDATIVVWSKNELFVNRLDENASAYEAIAKTKAQVITDIDMLATRGVTKILWHDTVEKVNGYIENLTGKISDSITFCTSRPYFLEFNSAEVSKAAAMDFIGGHLDIKQSEMIAIGDGFNDLSMIQYAGLGVAMGNAEDGVKAHADYVTASNDEDGIAQVVEKYVMK